MVLTGSPEEPIRERIQKFELGQFQTFTLTHQQKIMAIQQASWMRAEHFLVEAKTLLLPEVIAANASDLQQFDEFLDVNELGLAFEWLESIAYNDQPTCPSLLNLLRSAAEEMNLHEHSAELDRRIRALNGPLADE